MRCPSRGKERKRGYLNARGPVIWPESGEKLTIFPFKEDITLIGAPAVNKPPPDSARTAKLSLGISIAGPPEE